MKTVQLIAATLLASANTAFAHYRCTNLYANGSTTADYYYVRQNTNYNSPVTNVSSDDIRCNTGTQQAAKKPSYDGEDLEEDLSDQREINGVICHRVWTWGREGSFYQDPTSKVRHYNLCPMPDYEQDNRHEQVLDGARRFAIDFIEGE